MEYLRLFETPSFIFTTRVKKLQKLFFSLRCSQNMKIFSWKKCGLLPFLYYYSHSYSESLKLVWESSKTPLSRDVPMGECGGEPHPKIFHQSWHPSRLNRETEFSILELAKFQKRPPVFFSLLILSLKNVCQLANSWRLTIFDFFFVLLLLIEDFSRFA